MSERPERVKHVMRKFWPRPLPFDGICEQCRVDLPRGTTAHECDVMTRYLAENGAVVLRREPDRALAILPVKV